MVIMTMTMMMKVMVIIWWGILVRSCDLMWSTTHQTCSTGKHQFAMMEDNHDVARKEQIQSRSQRSSAEEEQAKKWSCDLMCIMWSSHVAIGTSTTWRSLVLRISGTLQHYSVFIRLVSSVSMVTRGSVFRMLIVTVITERVGWLWLANFIALCSWLTLG